MQNLNIKMKLQEIITKDEQDRVVRNKFYISTEVLLSAINLPKHH